MISETCREYGKKPFTVVVVHGGPGAVGDMSDLAEKLAERFGIIEPLLCSDSIQAQVQELSYHIQERCDYRPVILIGHSWGAWLSFIFTGRFSREVRKLILVSAGAFEKKYSSNLTKLRLSRLSQKERLETLELMDRIANPVPDPEISGSFRRFGELMTKADSFDPEMGVENVDFRSSVYRSVWAEAEVLRDSGTLLEMGRRISCPVSAIHGDYDPHQAAGVCEPLSKVLLDFRFHLLERCGH
ncbi:MAG TPA: alpha/beta hydrolase [Candidatus Kryptonia bacterium]